MITVSESLRLGYAGGTFDKNRMEARQLSEVYKDLQKLLDIINEDIFEDGLDFTLFVEAPEPGSLLEKFKIEGNLDQLNQLFKDHPLVTVTLCLALISSIILNGAMTPEHLAKYKEIGDDVLDRIERVAEKKRTQNVVNKLVKPFNKNLNNDSFLTIQGESTEVVTVKSENLEKALASLPEADRDQVTVDKHPASLISLVRPDLKGGKKWDVSFNDSDGDNHNVTIIIEDAMFLAYMATESVSLSRDHALYANVEERVTKKAGNERFSRKWFITKVYTMKDVKNGKLLYEAQELKDL